LTRSPRGRKPLQDGPECSPWSGSIRPSRPATGYLR
jgi:hypothetical protein